MSATEVASAAVHDKLVGVTTCCICDETYREPKILPCVHTFCVTCLQRTGTQTKKRPGDQMPCPLCRQEFTVPREGFAGLQKNFFMEGLVEIVATRHEASGVCEKHELENLCLFCSDCREVLCLVCLRESHQNHRLSDLGRAASFLRSQLESDAKRYMSDALKKMERLAQKKVVFFEKMEGFEVKVLQVTSCMKAILDQLADSFLQNLGLLKQKGITDLEIVEKELREHLSTLKNIAEYCAEQSDGHDSLICNRAIELREQVVKLELFSKSTTECQLRSLEVYFAKNVLAPFIEAFCKTDVSDLMGKVEAVQSMPQRYYFIDPELVMAIGVGDAAEAEGDGIIGMTVTNNRIFIVNYNNPVVRIYDSDTLWYLSSLNVADYMSHVVLGPCASVDETVYIVNRILSEILQIDENLVVSKWSTENDWRGLSVSDASTIVATCYETSAIREYTPEGTLLHEIEFGSCMLHPSHAIKLSNGHFVVGHSGPDDNSSGVCLVNPDGGVMKSFDDLRGLGIKHFVDAPTCLAVDDDGNVLVLDGYNSRVLLLSSELEFKRELLTKANGLRWPVAMHFDKKTCRLYIADKKLENFLFSDSKILVFDVKYAL